MSVRHRITPSPPQSDDSATGAPFAGHRLLVVNADDYGLTRGISRAVLRAHREGIVTSTSVLAGGPALPVAGPWLREAPKLGVGAHLAVVDSVRPLLSAREIPSLVDGSGHFAADWRAFVSRLSLGAIDVDDLHREFAAQIERVRALATLTHVDSHQHVHLFPPVRDVVIALAREFKIPCVRVPRSRGRRALGSIVNFLAGPLATRIRESGLYCTSDAVGFDEAGAMEGQRLRSALASLAAVRPRSAEVIVHPGEDGDPEAARHAWGYSWGAELCALTDGGTRELVEASGFQLATFAAIATGDPLAVR